LDIRPFLISVEENYFLTLMDQKRYQCIPKKSVAQVTRVFNIKGKTVIRPMVF